MASWTYLEVLQFILSNRFRAHYQINLIPRCQPHISYLEMSSLLILANFASLSTSAFLGSIQWRLAISVSLMHLKILPENLLWTPFFLINFCARLLGELHVLAFLVLRYSQKIKPWAVKYDWEWCRPPSRLALHHLPFSFPLHHQLDVHAQGNPEDQLLEDSLNPPWLCGAESPTLLVCEWESQLDCCILTWWLISEEHCSHSFYFSIHSLIRSWINISQTLTICQALREALGKTEMTQGGHKVYLNQIIKTPYSWSHSNRYVSR